MKQLTIYTVLAGLLFCGGCRKFVEVPPTNVLQLKYTRDYQNLLYNATVMEKGYGYPIYASDDVSTTELTWQNVQNLNNANAYTWKERIVDAGQEDNDWVNYYKAIYYCNQVVLNVMTSEGGTEFQKKNALAYALTHRAYYYYTLVNQYAKQYDATTAATDPGVPLVLGLGFFTDLTRASVAKVYEQVFSDLQAALPDLPVTPDFPTNPSKAAAHAIMAKAYLDMRNFGEAKRYADSALKNNSNILDLNLFTTSTTAFPRKTADPESILFKVAGVFPVGLPISADMLTRLDTKDLRYQVYTQPGASILGSNFTQRGYMRYRITIDGLSVGITVPEIMLIKAECEARAGNTDAAITILNTLRRKRFKPADYADLTAATAQEAFDKVIDERRVELMATGRRWFDQRRLQKEADFTKYVTTVTRTFKGETFTLAPGSNRYTFPIADKYIQFNPEIVQNPR